MAAPWVEKLSAVWSPVKHAGQDGATSVRRLGLSLGSDRSSKTDQLAAMQMVGTLFGIVDRIASSQSAIEWTLYQRAASGRKEDRIEVQNHLALDMWNKPNDWHDGPTVIEAGQQHYELTGETWLVVDREESFRDIPLGMWNVRPDRMTPVPGEETFLVGYIYTSDEGEKIPLELDEVLFFKRPNPLDPYRGLGVVQTVMNELATSKAVGEWNRNFFKNGAMPGGVIEVPTGLDPYKFDELVARWRDGHRGVNRAHRIGILEQGAKFNPTTYSVKDLMVTEMRTMTRDAVMEAVTISKHMLGITEDVNRANAQAGEYVYAKYIDKQRATRWRGMLNNQYLPLFGDARPLEFDFKNPVPEDTEALNAERESKARAAKDYVDAGYDPDDVLETVGAPAMRHTGVVQPRTAERSAQ